MAEMQSTKLDLLSFQGKFAAAMAGIPAIGPVLATLSQSLSTFEKNIQSFAGYSVAKGLKFVDSRYSTEINQAIAANGAKLLENAAKDYVVKNIGVVSEAIGIDDIQNRLAYSMHNIITGVGAPQFMADAAAAAVAYETGSTFHYEKFRNRLRTEAGLPSSDVATCFNVLYSRWLATGAGVGSTIDPLPAVWDNQKIPTWDIPPQPIQPTSVPAKDDTLLWIIAGSVGIIGLALLLQQPSHHATKTNVP